MELIMNLILLQDLESTFSEHRNPLGQGGLQGVIV